MLAIHLSLAALAVTALATRPRSNWSAAVVASIAVLELSLGASGASAITVVGPVIAFLTAAMTLAAIATHSGLADRAALALAAAARGHAAALYVLTCLLCSLMTAVISLDGAVVLMVPIVLALHRQHDAALAPLLLGVVGVANAASIAVPQGNPTNLVLINHLHLSPLGFTSRMLIPGAVATLVCVIAVALLERRSLRDRYRRPELRPTPLSGEQRRALMMLAVAALVAWSLPLAGIQPWWPFAGVAVLALPVTRAWSMTRPGGPREPDAWLPRAPLVVVPWRIAVQIAGLVVIAGAIGIHPPHHSDATVPILLAVAVGTGAAAAVAGNLPTSVWAASLLSAGPVALAAAAGLAVGALAAPQGSVATLIAADLAGPGAPRLSARSLAPVALTALIAATMAMRALL